MQQARSNMASVESRSPILAPAAASAQTPKHWNRKPGRLSGIMNLPSMPTGSLASSHHSAVPGDRAEPRANCADAEDHDVHDDEPNKTGPPLPKSPPRGPNRPPPPSSAREPGRARCGPREGPPASRRCASCAAERNQPLVPLRLRRSARTPRDAERPRRVAARWDPRLAGAGVPRPSTADRWCQGPRPFPPRSSVVASFIRTEPESVCGRVRARPSWYVTGASAVLDRGGGWGGYRRSCLDRFRCSSLVRSELIRAGWRRARQSLVAGPVRTCTTRDYCGRGAPSFRADSSTRPVMLRHRYR